MTRTSRDEDVRDELPADLDMSAFVGPYVFPNNSRRRVPGVLYLIIAALLVALWALAGDSPLVNEGYLLAAGLLAVAGGYSLASGWNLNVDERDALVAATAEVGFAVGHASAQMGWRGLLSRPTWRILLYSAENPPTRRGLVLVDGVDGADHRPHRRGQPRGLVRTAPRAGPARLRSPADRSAPRCSAPTDAGSPHPLVSLPAQVRAGSSGIGGGCSLR